MDSKTRGWIYIIGAIVAGYLGWMGNNQWSLVVLSLLFLASGYHHAFGRK